MHHSPPAAEPLTRPAWPYRAALGEAISGWKSPWPSGEPMPAFQIVRVQSFASSQSVTADAGAAWTGSESAAAALRRAAMINLWSVPDLTVLPLPESRRAALTQRTLASPYLR